MIQLSLKTDFTRLERSLMAVASGPLLKRAAAVALTRTAAGARRDVRLEMPKVFDRPTPFTVNSIRFSPADADRLEATVFISDDAAKGLSPRKYLRAEIEGGARGQKRGERALIGRGLMEADQRVTPGSAMPLNQYGNISGGRMVQMLSRVTAFSEQGYAANAADKTMRRLARLKRAVRSTRTDYFVGKSRLDGGPGAIYQLVATGVVKPVLWFVRRAPSYAARFDFHGLVAKSAASRWPGEMARALTEAIRRAF